MARKSLAPVSVLPSAEKLWKATAVVSGWSRNRVKDRRSSLRFPLTIERDCEDERGPFARIGFRFHIAAVDFHDLLTDCQAYAGAGIQAPRVQALKDIKN